MKKWYQQQRPAFKLAITLLGNSLFWLLFYALMKIVWSEMDEHTNIRALLFRSMFMGFFWTILFSWPLTKSVFSTSQKKEDVT